MKQGDIVNRENSLKCPNCKNELEEEYQGNFYFDSEDGGYDEEISKYVCKNCGAIYQGRFLFKDVEYLEVIEKGKEEEKPKSKFNFEIY